MNEEQRKFYYAMKGTGVGKKMRENLYVHKSSEKVIPNLNSFKSKLPRWGRKPLQESSNDDYKEDLQAVVRAASNQAAAFSSAVSTGAAGAAKLFRSWSSSFDERMKRVNNEDT